MTGVAEKVQFLLLRGVFSSLVKRHVLLGFIEITRAARTSLDEWASEDGGSTLCSAYNPSGYHENVWESYGLQIEKIESGENETSLYKNVFLENLYSVNQFHFLESFSWNFILLITHSILYSITIHCSRIPYLLSVSYWCREHLVNNYVAELSPHGTVACKRAQSKILLFQRGA